MKYLLVMLWPVGMGLVVLVAAILARRPERHLARRRRPERLPSRGGTLAAGLPEPVRLIGITVAGWIAVVAIMVALGAAWVVHDGPRIDRPIYSFVVHHRVPDWTSAMTQLTKVADLPEALVAAAVAAVWLALAWDERKWVPPVILMTIVVVDHFLTGVIRSVFDRVGPPNSPGGTYPSGGCERAILYFGLIAYLALRQAGWSRSHTIVAAAVVAALAFNEVYTRIYLTLHWFTDAISGLVYGTMLLAIVIFGVRTAIGPAPAHESSDAPGRPRLR